MSDTHPDQECPSVTITTDGAARGNPGPGGWAALLQMERGGETIERLLTGQEEATTTNNAMEIEAVIGGLAALKRPCAVALRIDSTYVITGIKRIQEGRPFQVGAKNDERWTRLAAAMRPHAITVEWVRGHAGDSRNERVDEAATLAAQVAYERLEREKHVAQPHAAAAWTLAICSSDASRPVQWALRTSDAYQQTDVKIADATEATAVWQALIDGLRNAMALADGQPVDITIFSNYDLLIKQGRGEWKVKNPTQQPLAAQLAVFRTKLGLLTFQYMKTDELRRHIDLTD